MIFDSLKTLGISHSPLLGAVSGIVFGAATEASGMVQGGNTAFFVALCGLAGGFFATLPRIITARSHAKISESEFIGKETRALIETLRKNASDSERILAMTNTVRHHIQGSYQNAVWHISLLEMMLDKEQIDSVPKHTVLDVARLLKEMDDEIVKIKNAAPVHMS